MTTVREIVKDTTIGVGVADTPEGLWAIHDPGCAAVIWRRQPLAGFQSWLDALEPSRLPNARMVLRANQVHEAASQICDAAGTPACVERNRLIDDVAALADIFAGLMRTTFLRLRFDVVTNNACRKFHVDAVKARLICTYRGMGTQYGISTNGAEPERVFTVRTGSPMILRGTLWPEVPGSGLLHRSPPIDGTGETRLVLVLDPVVDGPRQHRSYAADLENGPALAS